MVEEGFTDEQLKAFEDNKISFADLVGIPGEMLAYFAEVAYNYYDVGKYDEAEKIMRTVIDLDPKIAYSHTLMGAIYQKQEKWDDAIKEYTESLQLKPDDTSALVNRGELYLQSGAFDEAAQDLEKAIDLDPDGKDSYALRARALVVVTHDLLKEAEKKAKEGA